MEGTAAQHGHLVGVTLGQRRGLGQDHLGGRIRGAAISKGQGTTSV